MKEFFQKKSVAITITLVVIALAVVIGAVSAPKGAQTQSSASLSADASGWAKKNYAQYEDFLDDDADLFDDDAIETFAKYDAQLDYGYGSILGLVSTDSLDGKSMEDYAMDASADLELGDSDMLLLIDTDTEQWYLAYGGDMADYVDNDLSILFRQNLGSLFTGSAEKRRDGALSGPARLVCGKHSGSERQCRPAGIPAYVQKEESGIDLFGILITILVIVILFKIFFRPRRRYYNDGVYYGGGPRPGFWSGMFWARCSAATADIVRLPLRDRDRGIARPPQDPDPAVFTQDRAAPASSPAREALAAARAAAASVVAAADLAAAAGAAASAAVADNETHGISASLSERR